jgi:hypothetical protein
MLQSYKQRWIDSLRSGASNENRQYPFYLRTEDDEFSVFGVLCDTLDSVWFLKKYLGIYDFGGYLISIPHRIKQETKLTDEQVGLVDDLQIDGLRFWDIADWIEDYIRGE